MQDNTEQHLDKLAEKIMKSSFLEQPSMDFTEHLMTKIEASTSKVTAYKPLISKHIWFTIAILIIGIISYSLLGTELKTSEWLNAIDFSILSNNKVTETVSNFSFSISNILMYAIVFFGLAFFIQITVLKNYHQKRLNY
ncbi:hypothetical protein D7030_12440 [Flavobacteriaceae bacterium AU392]|nr:hypothetical protein D1817_06050 [Flavobacteriaceae bacterium]RKM81124.1 hypothetical protein D7030_12440 [Flavobacteriaceae bacterium AU392]